MAVRVRQPGNVEGVGRCRDRENYLTLVVNLPCISFHNLIVSTVFGGTDGRRGSTRTVLSIRVKGTPLCQDIITGEGFSGVGW